MTTLQIPPDPIQTIPKSPAVVQTVAVDDHSMDRLGVEVQELFVRGLDSHSLLSMSKSLQTEMKRHLRSKSQNMLPSFNYELPTGQEQGLYLALEVGGSTLRMAMVELHGRESGKESMRIRRTMSAPIDKTVRQLQDYAFFDWMAGNIRQLLALEDDTKDMRTDSPPLRMGVAWSFPIDQTSIRSGNVLGMGKGFHCSDIVRGHDLGDIIEKACQRARLNVRLDAIVNDSSSALLARAYLDSATRIAVILGTGFNAAIHIPIRSLEKFKFGSRDMSGTGPSTHVVTNTEFSMYGKSILPTTRWDDHLNATHIMPDYQPYEYLVAGGYIGEIVRLILVEAADTFGFYGGSLPISLHTPYSLDTRTLALIDVDQSDSLNTSRSILQNRHPSTHTLTSSELYFIRQILRSVINRSYVFFAAGVHSLTSLLEDLETEASLPFDLEYLSIGCDGSIINKYPGYMERAQDLLDSLREQEGGQKRRVILEKTQESAVLGAGVAGAVAAYHDVPGTSS